MPEVVTILEIRYQRQIRPNSINRFAHRMALRCPGTGPEFYTKWFDLPELEAKNAAHAAADGICQALGLEMQFSSDEVERVELEK